MKTFLMAFFFFFIFFGIIFLLRMHHQSNITIDGYTFTVMLAKTQQEQEKGLGYKDMLPENQGMLFLFDHPYIETFWMKGMRFPLDIIYLRNNRISDIFSNIQNPTKQNTNIQIVNPTQPADEVLEINAGLAQKYHFKIGDSMQTSL